MSMHKYAIQPQCNTPLDPYWLGRGLVIACNPAIGARNQVAKYNYTVTNVGGMATVPTPIGLLWQGDTSKYVDFGSSYAATMGVTILQIVNPGSASGFTFTSRSSVGSDGIELLIGSGGTLGDTQARMSASNVSTPIISGLNDNKDHVVVIRWTPSVELAVWSDGLFSKKAVTSSVPASLSPAQNLRLHRRAVDGAYAGKSGLFLYFDRPLADAEIEVLLENPWQIFTYSVRKNRSVISIGGVTYIISPIGGIDFSGEVELTKTKIYLPTGNINFNGNNPVIKTRVLSPQGTFTLSGDNPVIKSKVISSNGTVVFSGTSPLIRSKVIESSGAIVFSGSASLSGAVSYIITPSGNVSFSGTTSIIKSHIQLPIGKISFSGNAPINSNTVIITVSTRLPLTGIGK